MAAKKRSHKRKPAPVMVVRMQAVAVMKEALEDHGFMVTREVWDGGSQTESFEVRSRGVDTLVIVADPAYLSEPDPASFVEADKYLLKNPRRRP